MNPKEVRNLEEGIRIEVSGEGPYLKITIEVLDCEDCHKALSAFEQELSQGSKGKGPRLVVYPKTSAGKSIYHIKLLR